MRNRLIYAAAVATVMALAVGTTAASDDNTDRRGASHFKLSLDGFQENPSISTTGRGRLELRIDDEAQTIEFELSYTDLEGVGTTPFVTNGVVLASHIHVGVRGTNGGVSAFFCGGGGRPACPSPEASEDNPVTGTIMASDIIGPAAQGINAGEATAFAELVRAIRAGYAYGNVHTTRWPGGEIRGQINDRGRDRDHD